MDGLEDQAEAALAGLLQQLRCEERVEIGRSSRDTLISRIAAELQNKDNNKDLIVTKTLVLRGGISVNGLAMLHRGLAENETIDELQFFCLKSIAEIQGAIDCCRRQPRIRSLSLKNYTPTMSRRGELGRAVIAATIRDCVFGNGTDQHYEGPEKPGGGIPSLQTLEIVGYPIGTAGLGILSDAVARNTTLSTLRLVDCDLRSDSARFVANMVKQNRHLKELDLCYNRDLLGSEMTKGLVVKTVVQRGLRFNISLVELKMAREGPTKESTIDRQLNCNKFREAFVNSTRDPFQIPPQLWTHVLARAAVKAPVLYLFLQEAACTLFR